MALTALKRKTAGRQIADELRDHIVRGEIAPGERLTEGALADKFAVSRGSVRAALQLLQQEGLIAQTPYAGWSVSTLDVGDIWELYTLRARLEGLAAELAAARMNDEGRALLTEVYQRMVDLSESHDKPAIAAVDFELHKTVVRLSGHRRLESLYSVVEQQVRMCIVSSDDVWHERQSILVNHTPIYEALMNGDSVLAGRLLKEHNETEGQKLVQYMLSRNPPANPVETLPRRRGRPRTQAAIQRKHAEESS